MEHTNLVTVVNRIISIKSMFCLQISLLNSHVSTLAKMLLQSFLQKCFSLLYHGKIKIFNFFFFYKPLCENLFDFKVKTTMSQNSLSIWHWKKPNNKWVSTHPVHVNIWILAYRSIRLVRLWRSAAWNRVRFSGFIWALTHNNILSILLSYTGWVREIESNLIDSHLSQKQGVQEAGPNRFRAKKVKSSFQAPMWRERQIKGFNSRQGERQGKKRENTTSGTF